VLVTDFQIPVSVGGRLGDMLSVSNGMAKALIESLIKALIESLITALRFNMGCNFSLTKIVVAFSRLKIRLYAVKRLPAHISSSSSHGP
jgi:hypothetical protein